MTLIGPSELGHKQTQGSFASLWNLGSHRSGEAGCTLAQFALAWVLREPNVASAIVGASRPAQLEENAAAADLVIDLELFRKAEAMVAGAQRNA